VGGSGQLPRDGGKLRKLALAYPEAYEEMPWGHHAVKVRGKPLSSWLQIRPRSRCPRSCPRQLVSPSSCRLPRRRSTD
jgi:hypothetical protein